jgi:hypothetical protein
MSFVQRIRTGPRLFMILRDFIFLWLYKPILGLGRLHETFRFISVTRSRTVGGTPWAGDQLVARPPANCPGWLWWWRSLVEWTVFGRGNRSTQRKTALTPLFPPLYPHKSHFPDPGTDPGTNPGRRSGKPATNRFSYDAASSHPYSKNINTTQNEII